MTGPHVRAPGGAYEGAGRQISVALRGYSSVIVTSEDVVAAAHAAIGIALAESAHRLVMIGDLGGETAPIQTLVRGDDVHGIYDCFEFGTSFVRIAHEVEGAKNMFVMPGGTESPATGEIIGSPRWRNFASEFASADELLLLVVSATAPGLARLAEQLDGVVLVGMDKLDAAPAATILARMAHPAVVAPVKREIAPRREAWPLKQVGIAAAALLTVGILGGVIVGSRSGSRADVPAAVVADSATIDSVAVPDPVIAPENPADSSRATPFSVRIQSSNTAEGANFEIQRYRSAMPAATISLVPIGDTEAIWYTVYAGAYADSAEAGRLLATLRRRRIVRDEYGSVVRAPLAFLVDTIPSQAGMSRRVAEKLDELRVRQVHAYALMQPDGSARVYSGAFDQPQQSSLTATALRVAGLTPVLSYRTGRLR